jgi:hypothetical protein
MACTFLFLFITSCSVNAVDGYRDSILSALEVAIRDFQFNVINCRKLNCSLLFSVLFVSFVLFVVNLYF